MAQWLLLPGTAGHNVDTPDHADLDITGDLDIRVRAALDDPTPAAVQTFLGKYESTGNQRSYVLQIETNGRLTFAWSEDGSVAATQTSTVTVPFAAGELGWVRATIDVDNGAGGANITFYTSTDATNDPAAVTWAQLGAVGGTTATSIFASTENLEGGSQNGATSLMAGKLYVIALYNGIAGTKVAHFDAEDFQAGDSDTDSAVDASGKTWTIHGANSEIETDDGVSGGSNLLLLPGIG